MAGSSTGRAAPGATEKAFGRMPADRWGRAAARRHSHLTASHGGGRATARAGGRVKGRAVGKLHDATIKGRVGNAGGASPVAAAKWFGIGNFPRSGGGGARPRTGRAGKSLLEAAHGETGGVGGWPRPRARRHRDGAKEGSKTNFRFAQMRAVKWRQGIGAAEHAARDRGRSRTDRGPTGGAANVGRDRPAGKEKTQPTGGPSSAAARDAISSGCRTDEHWQGRPSVG